MHIDGKKVGDQTVVYKVENVDEPGMFWTGNKVDIRLSMYPEFNTSGTQTDLNHAANTVERLELWRKTPRKGKPIPRTKVVKLIFVLDEMVDGPPQVVPDYVMWAQAIEMTFEKGRARNGWQRKHHAAFSIALTIQRMGSAGENWQQLTQAIEVDDRLPSSVLTEMELPYVARHERVMLFANDSDAVHAKLMLSDFKMKHFDLRNTELLELYEKIRKA